MRIIVKLICILLAVVLLICTAACNHAPIDPLEGIITETEYNEIKVYIDELAKEKELDLMAYSGYCYFFEREYSDNLCQVGYKGLPVLLTEIDKRLKSGDKSNIPDSFISIVYALLRIYEIDVDKIDDDGNARSLKETFYMTYVGSKKQVPKIIKSKKGIEEKIVELRDFGILAIPYVLEQIEKGNAQYESYFTAIGLHMDTVEFMTYMSTIDWPWEQGYDKEGFMDGAEDFDYKVWLSENEEDLDNLFKFLEAYCAEYEAEK